MVKLVYVWVKWQILSHYALGDHDEKTNVTEHCKVPNTAVVMISYFVNVAEEKYYKAHISRQSLREE